MFLWPTARARQFNVKKQNRRMRKKTKQMKTTMAADYTQNGRIKIKSTAEPFMRPTYEQWIKELKITHSVYDMDCQAKERAKEINSHMGIKIDERTIWEVLGGEEY